MNAGSIRIRWGLFAAFALSLPVVAAGKEPVAAWKPVDRFGDPLPKGAIARLGSIRFKHDTLDVRSVAFSPDGKLIASGGGDCTVRIWETSTGKPVAVLRGHEFSVRKRRYATPTKEIVREYKVLRDYQGRVTGLDFSPDGKLLASSDRNRLIVWEVGTWRQRVKVDRKFSALPDGSRLRFTRDSKAIILSDRTSRLYRFRVKDGKVEAKSYSPGIRSFDIHPDGKRVVGVADHADRIGVYNISDLSLIASEGKNDHGADVAIFPDGKRAIVAGGGTQIWDLQTLKTLRQKNIGKNRGFGDNVVASPDGRWIAGTLGNHDAVLILDAKTEHVVRLIRNVRNVRDLAFSPDGKLLAAADTQVRLWRVGKWTEVGSDELLTPVVRAKFRDGGGVVDVGGAFYDLHGKLLKSVDPRRMNLAGATYFHPFQADFTPTRVFEDPQGRLLVREWSPWGHSVIVRDFKTSHELWRHETRNQIDPTKDWANFIRQYDKSYRLPIRGIRRTKLSRNGRRILILYKQSNPGFSVYSAPDGNLLRRVSIPDENGIGVDIEAATISPDGELVAATSRNGGEVYLWNVGYKRKLTLGKLLYRLPWEKRESFHNLYLSFSPNGRYLIGWMNLSSDKEKRPPLYVWDVRSGKVMHKLPFGGPRGIHYHRYHHFSPDGKSLMVYSAPFVRVYALPNGRKIAEFSQDRPIAGHVFSSDSRFLAIGTDGLIVWDAKRNKVVMEFHNEHAKMTGPLGFLPDGRLLARFSRAGEIQAWDLKTHKHKKVFKRPPDRHGYHVAITPDGKYLITVHDNRTALVWKLPPLEEK